MCRGAARRALRPASSAARRREMTLRFRKGFTAAALLAVVLGMAPAVQAGSLPVAEMGEWEVLALDGGLFASRATSDPKDVGFVYGFDSGDRNKEMVVVSWSGSAD